MIKMARFVLVLKTSSSQAVGIRMVVPIKESQNDQDNTKVEEATAPNDQNGTIRLSLEDIIIAGLSKKPRETNYKSTKAFAEQYEQPNSNGKESNKKRGSLDTEQEGSPGDSDYESAQEAGLPFRIRKQAIILTNSKTKPAPQKDEKIADKIDFKIQKSIKDFFQAS